MPNHREVSNVVKVYVSHKIDKPVAKENWLHLCANFMVHGIRLLVLIQLVFMLVSKSMRSDFTVK